MRPREKMCRGETGIFYYMKMWASCWSTLHAPITFFPAISLPSGHISALSLNKWSSTGQDQCVQTEGKCVKSVRFLPHSWDPSQSKRKSRTWPGLQLHSLKQLLWLGVGKFKLPCYLLSLDTWQWCVLTLQYRTMLCLKHKYAGISAPQTLLKALRDQEAWNLGPK